MSTSVNGPYVTLNQNPVPLYKEIKVGMRVVVHCKGRFREATVKGLACRYTTSNYPDAVKLAFD